MGMGVHIDMIDKIGLHSKGNGVDAESLQGMQKKPNSLRYTAYYCPKCRFLRFHEENKSALESDVM
jgi:hypothetical protein